MNRKWFLPIAAILLLGAAIALIILTPGKEKPQETSPYAERNSEGNIVIRADRLTNETVSFIRIAADSKIELLAHLDGSGHVKAALGTCQSCNGSPNAYFIQEGDHLKCNNCGLTFPLDVLDTPGYGCHPIMIDPAMITENDIGIVIDTGSLMTYEPLFEKVAVH